MRVRVLKGMFYGHRHDVEPELEVDADDPLVVRGLKHGLIEEVTPEQAAAAAEDAVVAAADLKAQRIDDAITMDEDEMDIGQSADGVLCGAETSRGGPCEKPAGWGTDHEGAGLCRYHDKEG